MLDAIVVGGGQAGLASGYWLRRAGLRFEILDAGAAIGQSWRDRWDSLELFTPARYSELPGMSFPRPAGAGRFWCPDKDRMADYLTAYAERFSLPVRLGSRVERLERHDGGYELTTSSGERRRARAVIAASGAHQVQRIPDFAAGLDPAIQTLGSTEYRRPAQLRSEQVLVVGAGASGVEIALELAAAGREVTLAGPDLLRLPRRVLGLDIFWWLYRSGVIRARCDRPIGRLICRQGRLGGDELVGVSRGDLRRAGVRRVGRIVAASGGRPRSEDGETIGAGSVVWAAGLGYEFERWIELPILDESGIPRQERGVVRGEPGLYLVGLPYQSRPNSGLVGGVGADARYVVERIAARAGN